jgi:hypothetical protein
MKNLIETANEYVSPKAKNISEAGIFDATKLTPLTETHIDKDTGKPYEVITVQINGEKYKVPPTVLEGIKVTVKARPTATMFSVTKTGNGKTDTRYQVIAQN